MTAENGLDKEVGILRNGRLHIVFDEGVNVQTEYHLKFDNDRRRCYKVPSKKLKSPENGEFDVETGDTVRFKLSGRDNSKLISVYNYRMRGGHEPSAVIKEIKFTENGMEMVKIADLSSDNNVEILDDIGAVFWVDEHAAG